VSRGVVHIYDCSSSQIFVFRTLERRKRQPICEETSKIYKNRMHTHSLSSFFALITIGDYQLVIENEFYQKQLLMLFVSCIVTAIMIMMTNAWFKMSRKFIGIVCLITRWFTTCNLKKRIFEDILFKLTVEDRRWLLTYFVKGTVVR